MASGSSRLCLAAVFLAFAAVQLSTTAKAQDLSSAFDMASQWHYNGSTSIDNNSYWSHNYAAARRAQVNEQIEEEQARAALAKQQREAAIRRQQEEEAAEARRQAAINRANDLFQQGSSAAAAGAYVVAIEDFQNAIGNWPDGQNSAFAAALNKAIADLKELSVIHAYAASALKVVSSQKVDDDPELATPSVNAVMASQAHEQDMESPSINAVLASQEREQSEHHSKAAGSARPRSPGTSRAYMGWRCLQAHDWKLAYAWYEEALVRDPTNKALQGMVRYTRYAAQTAPDPISRRNGGAGVYVAGTPGPSSEMLRLMDGWAKSNPDLLPPGSPKTVPGSTQEAMASQ